jgi:hypothetical protein
MAMTDTRAGLVQLADTAVMCILLYAQLVDPCQTVCILGLLLVAPITCLGTTRFMWYLFDLNVVLI